MAAKYNRGPCWYLDWIDPETGKRRRVSLGRVTEAEAEAERQAKELQLAGGPDLAGPPFGRWAVTYGTWHAAEYPDSYPRILSILERHLLPAFAPLPLLGITPQAAEAYKARRAAEGAAAGTVLKEWRTLQAMLNRAVSLGVISHNPIAMVRAPRNLASRPPAWFTREDLARIYATELEVPKCARPEAAADHRAYRWTWQLLANTGLRRGEAQHLIWSDIGAEEIGVRSEPGARTKSGKWRSVWLADGAREALEALRPSPTPRPSGPVLPICEPRSLSRAFTRTLERAELPGNLHSLRHTYVSALVRAGVPLPTVQVLAGHASFSTTLRYSHLAPSDLREAVSRLNL